MRIVNTVGKECPPFDCASGLAELLFHLNVAKKYVETIEKKTPDVTWKLHLPGMDCATLGLSGLCRGCGATVDLYAGRHPERVVLHHLPKCNGTLESPSIEFCEGYRRAWDAAHPRSLVEKTVDKLQEFRRDLRDGVAVPR